MHDASISRNYAEALLTLATKAGDAEGWGATVSALGDAVTQDVTLSRFLAAPQVSAAQKNQVLAKALEGKAHPTFIRFVQKLVSNRRQLLIPDVAVEYHNLLDVAAGRVHARVTVAREFDAAAQASLTAALSKALNKTVVAHMTVDERIIGGVVVRVGDTVMDGSVRRKLGRLREKLVNAR
jgi:F-type H+-transporting ATPase subunit delta